MKEPYKELHNNYFAVHRTDKGIVYGKLVKSTDYYLVLFPSFSLEEYKEQLKSSKLGVEGLKVKLTELRNPKGIVNIAEKIGQRRVIPLDKLVDLVFIETFERK